MNVGGGGDIASMWVKGSKTGWISMSHNWGASYQAFATLKGQTLSFKLISYSTKQILVANNVAPSNWNVGMTYKANVNFHWWKRSPLPPAFFLLLAPFLWLLLRPRAFIPCFYFSSSEKNFRFLVCDCICWGRICFPTSTVRVDGNAKTTSSCFLVSQWSQCCHWRVIN